jgi:uncharacterized BrkB/YihY/UPF0761 family membrane protein
MRFKQLKKILKNFGLLWQALRKFNDDNGFFLSSGITFNILINLIPFIMLLLALVVAYLYNDQEVLNHIRAYFRDVAPALDPKIMKNLPDVIQNRQIVGILGFVSLLWFSTCVSGSLRILSISCSGWRREGGSPQRIPQYVEVPPNIEAKRIISYFSAVLSY